MLELVVDDLLANLSQSEEFSTTKRIESNVSKCFYMTFNRKTSLLSTS